MPDSAPRITVAICTRNRAAYLEQAIRSVVPQLAAHSEILVVDNGSTDNTPSLLATFSQNDSRIRTVREMTPGIARARNVALRNARGEWVLFFDDDEIAPANWLAEYLNFFDRHRAEKIGAVGGGCEPDFETPAPKWYDVEWARYDMGPAELRLQAQRTPGSGNCAYHRETVLNLGGFSEELARTEDTDLNLRLQKAGHEVWWIPRAAIRHFIPGARITFKSFTRLAFVNGMAVGRMRMRHRGKSPPAIYRAARALTAPFHALGFALLALVTWPAQHGRVAVRNIERAARALGIGWQLWLDLFRKPAP